MPAATRVERFRAARRDPGLAVLEGFHALKHALRFGADILEIVCIDAVATAELARRLAPDVADVLNGRLHPIDPAEFAVLAPTRVHTGVMAVATRPAVDPECVLARETGGNVVYLEDPSSPFNVGAATRVAAAAGAAALFTSGRVDPWSPASLRAAAGLAWALPVARLHELPETDRPIVAIHPDGPALDTDRVPQGAVLAFGAERHGLSAALLDRAELRAAIPMRAGVSSLNLATAVGIALYLTRR